MSKKHARSALGLKGVRLLTNLPEVALTELAEKLTWRRVPANQRVISRESHDQDVFLVILGSVRVTSFSASGKQVTFRDIPAGDWFGDFAAIDGKSRSADVFTLEDTLVASMSPGLFKHILYQYREVCDQVLLRLVTSLRELTERVFDISTLGVSNRVHAEVLRLARISGVADNRARIYPSPKHSEIGSQISTYREQVTRELSAMTKQGLLKRDGRALLVLDVARLERIVAEVRHTMLR